jgi:hypothetical protein
MPRAPVPHPDFVVALRLLARTNVPTADAWRLLEPTAARLGIPKPSYFTVRRVLRAERFRLRRRRERSDVILGELLAGRVPQRL